MSDPIYRLEEAEDLIAHTGCQKIQEAWSMVLDFRERGGDVDAEAIIALAIYIKTVPKESQAAPTPTSWLDIK